MYRNRKNYIKPAGWILFLLCFYAAASFTGCDPALFVSRSSHLSDLAADMMRPDLSYFPKILLPLFYTIQMSVTGTVTGSALALIVSPFGAVSLHFPSWARRLLRLLIQILRSFPALILALAATFLFGLGTFAGTFAITLYTFAIMTKLTYGHSSLSGPYLYGLCPFPGIYPCRPAGDFARVSDKRPVPL